MMLEKTSGRLPTRCFMHLIFAVSSFLRSPRSAGGCADLGLRSMNYRLAEPRDEGFPQSGGGRHIGAPTAFVWRARDLAYVPTLEELIAACGDQFGEMAATTQRVFRSFGWRRWTETIRQIPHRSCRPPMACHQRRSGMTCARPSGFFSYAPHNSSSFSFTGGKRITTALAQSKYSRR